MAENLLKYATWLTFSDDDEKYLSKVINSLASQHSAPEFIPHITVYGLIQTRLDELEKVIKKISQMPSFLVKKESILFSDNFWKTVYVQLQRDDSLDKIHLSLKESFKKYGDYEFNPHASLIYKKTSNSEKEEIIKKLSIKEEFHVTGIAIQEFNEEISKWKIQRHYRLQ